MSDDVVARGVVEVGFSAEGVDAGIAKIDKSLDNIATTAKAASKVASDSINKIGDGSKAVSNVDRSTKQIQNSIERATAAAAAGAKGNAAYFSSLASQRGADLNVLAPYIAQLESVERQTLASVAASRKLEESQKFLATLNTQTGGIGKSGSELAALKAAELGVADAAAPMIAKLKQAEQGTTAVGNSAKQTAFALRGVPAQFTDIFVSLQGGQKPLQVFLQQGGQLKDMFGGIGPAARALGSYVLGLVNPFTLLTAAVGGVALAYYNGSEESSRLNKAIITTGNIAGTSVGQLNDLAAGVGRVTGNYGLAREAAEALATSGVVSSKNLKAALQGVVAGAELTGGSVKGMISEFESIGKDPVKALVTLNEKYNFLTADVYKNVKALQDQGKTQEAVTLATNAFTNAITGRSSAVKESLGFIESSWKTIKTAISGAIDEALNFGRVQSDAQKLAEINSKLNAKLGIGRGGKANAVTGSDRTALEAERTRLQDIIKTSDAIAAATAKAQQLENKKIALVGYAEDSGRLTKSGLLSKQLADENKAFATAVEGFDKTSAEYQTALRAHQTAVSNILSSGDKKTATTNTYALELAKSYAELYKSGEALAAPQESQIERQQRLIDSFVGMDAAFKQYLQSQIDDATDRDFAVKLEAQNSALDAQTEAILRSADALQIETANMGKLPSAITDVTIARVNDLKAIYDAGGVAVPEIERQIEAYKRLKEAQQGKEVADASKKAAEESIKNAKDAATKIQRDYERMSDNIQRSITDALFRGFESGKGFAENLKATLINSFKTLVLRPIIEAAVKPVSDAVAGVSSSSGASSVFGGNGSLTSQGVSIFKAFSGGIDKMNNAYLTGIARFGQTVSNAGFDKLGNLITTNSALIGKVLPYTGAVMSLLKGDIKGAVFQAAGVAIGSYFGPVGGAIGGVIGSFVGGLFGSKKVRRYRDDSQSSYDGGVFNSSVVPDSHRSLGAQDGLASVAKQFSVGFGTLLSEFGLSDAINTRSFLTKKKDTTGNFSASFDGGSVSFNQVVGGKKDDIAKAFGVYAGQVLGPVLVQAIQASKLSSGIKALFDGFSNQTEVGDLINSTIALNDASLGLTRTFNITTDQAAQVAKITAGSNEELLTFIKGMTTLGNSFLTVGDVLIKTRDTLTAQFESSTLPSSLKEFDERMKAIDKTTQAGIEEFAALLSIREQFASYAGNLDGVKLGVKDAVFNLLPTAAQQKVLQQDLAKMFADASLAVPGSIDELIKIGQGIDFTSKAGLDLAAVFPTLVDAFMKTKDGVKAIMEDLVTSNKFATLAEYQTYQGVAKNYGGQFAADYVANISSSRISTANGKANINGNTQVLEILQALRSESKAADVPMVQALQAIAKSLKKWDGDGLPAERTIGAMG